MPVFLISYFYRGGFCMRKITFLGFSVLLSLLLFNSCGSTMSVAEKEKLATDVRAAVETGNFLFKATYAYPTGHRSIYLSPNFDVRVSSDKVGSYLPFFGRAYRAPMSPSEAGYRFTSTDFEYSFSQGSKSGQWDVVIKINDLNRPVTYRFDIWENGTARLNITDSDRQAISFQGELMPLVEVVEE